MLFLRKNLSPTQNLRRGNKNMELGLGSCWSRSESWGPRGAFQAYFQNKSTAVIIRKLILHDRRLINYPSYIQSPGPLENLKCAVNSIMFWLQCIGYMLMTTSDLTCTPPWYVLNLIAQANCSPNLTSGGRADRRSSLNGRRCPWLSSPFQRQGSSYCRPHSSLSPRRACRGREGNKQTCSLDTLIRHISGKSWRGENLWNEGSLWSCSAGPWTHSCTNFCAYCTAFPTDYCWLLLLMRTHAEFISHWTKHKYKQPSGEKKTFTPTSKL